MKSVQDYLPTKYWLMKSEPSVFSFYDLEKIGKEFWDGVRNYQARNFMIQEMQVGHKILFYHSNADSTGVAGLCEVAESAKPDLSALNKNSQFFDEKATLENPRWYAVTVGNPVRLKNFVTLTQMRADDKLKEMLLLRKGQRLSILPLAQEEYKRILELAGYTQ